MNKFLLAILVAMSMNFTMSENEDYLKYIDQFKDIAIDEMVRTGIPASIKLAQGIVESNAGKSELAQKANNHFGIKCGSSWTEKGYNLKDDDYDNKGRKIESCFRVYDSAQESFIAHSEFLRDPKKNNRYGRLFDLDPSDYSSWAHGLRASGYATNPRYPGILIKVIEDYKLYKFDYLALAGADQLALVDNKNDEKKDKTNVKPQRVFEINTASCIKARPGDTPWRLSERFEIPLRQLMSYNEQFKSKVEKIESGTIVYLQKKRKKFYGRKKHHYVKKGDTMMGIGQMYGITYKGLIALNNMPEGVEPKPGVKVSLRKKMKNGAHPAYYTPQEASEALKKEQEVMATVEKKEEKIQGTELVTVIETKEKNRFEQSAQRKETTSTASTMVSIEKEDGDYLPFTLSKKKIMSDDDVKEMREANKYIMLRADVPDDHPSADTEVRKDDAYMNFIIELNKNIDAPIDETADKNEVITASTDKYSEVQSATLHEVGIGDTLYSLYKEYGTSVGQIKDWNNLSDNTIKLGQKLRVK